MTTGTVVRCLGGGRVGRVRQLAPLLPADATPIAPAAGLVDGADGGAGFVFGQATFAFAAEDEVGRRLAAVQLVATGIASASAVAAGFGIGLATLWRWEPPTTPGPPVRPAAGRGTQAAHPRHHCGGRP